MNLQSKIREDGCRFMLLRIWFLSSGKREALKVEEKAHEAKLYLWFIKLAEAVRWKPDWMAESKEISRKFELFYRWSLQVIIICRLPDYVVSTRMSTENDTNWWILINNKLVLRNQYFSHAHNVQLAGWTQETISFTIIIEKIKDRKHR